MSLTIDDPPEIAACARCSSALTWCWSKRSGKWFAAIAEPSDRELFRVHRCPQFPGDRPPAAWREVEEQPPEVIHAGAQMVRQVLAERDQQGGEA